MILLWINLIISLFLTGLIWTIQIVHYPLFAKVSKENFTDYIKSHQSKISIIVMPVMIIELIAALLLLIKPNPFNYWVSVILFLLTLLIWLSTFFLQVPQHQKLLKAFDENAIKKLVNTNWIRTVAWTVKSIILCKAIIA